MGKKFCPKCESENVRMIITTMAALGAPQDWYCNNCGFRNVLFPEKEIKLVNGDKK
jgi:transposase-like protein